ncbi:MAG TPA: LamG domain-containing protein [Chitinophagaceae bacterium]|nr:LamG domain-containing protein [Chitinophagaceae bacterium]
MKNRIFFIAAVPAFVFISCRKEHQLPEKSTGDAESMITQSKPATPGSNLAKGLIARFAFDGNLKEANGLLAEGNPSTAGADIYTDDRHGMPEKAIKFNGRYGVDIRDVPAAGIDMTVTAWVKYDSATSNLTRYFVRAQSSHPSFAQSGPQYGGVISAPTLGTSSVPSGIIDDHWHHLAASYNGVDLKFYVDGVYIGNSWNPTGYVYPAGFTTDFELGFFKVVNVFWYGSMDELRFYNRVLKPAEIATLATF